MIRFSKDIERILNKKNIICIKNIILNDLKKREKRILKIIYINKNKNEIRKINKSLLEHDYTTDVITINYNNNDRINAEIIICLEQIISQAEKLKIKIEEEILRVIFHGYLHLVGFNDDCERNRKIMREEEDRLIKNVSRETK